MHILTSAKKRGVIIDRGGWKKFSNLINEGVKINGGNRNFRNGFE